MCISYGFIDDNVFEGLCQKHRGLFEQIKINCGKLKNEKYSISAQSKPEKAKNEGIYCLDDLKADMKLEISELQKKLVHRKERKKTLKDLDGFTDSSMNVSARGKELQNGNRDDQAIFLYYSTL